MVRLSLTAVVLATLYATAISAVEEEDKKPVVKVAAECQKDFRVAAQADLDTIKNCKIFQGKIDITQIAATQLKMEGVEELIGDLTMTGNVDLQQFSAPELRKVDGQIKIDNHTVLSKAEFPKLTEVKGFSMSVLPALENINFPAGLSKVNTARFQDTRAPKVEGFKPETIESFTLSSNNYMKSFDFNSVKEVTGDILILGNNHGMTFDAANLQSLQKGTFLNLNQLDMPSLATVKADISFHENEFESLKMDKLENVGGTMTVANNNRLTETSFKSLNLITGALSIGNNSHLDSIDGFPALAEVHGTVDLAGSFGTYNLPALQDVRGGMRLQTTSDKLGCSEIERKLKGDNIVKGNTWSCSASMQESNMAPTVGQNPSSPNSSGSSGNANSQASSANTLVKSSLFVFTMGLVSYLTV